MTFTCPLCGKKNGVFLGVIGPAGHLQPPKAECSCGFKFSPPSKYVPPAGSDGWAKPYGDQKDILNQIKATLHVVDGPAT